MKKLQLFYLLISILFVACDGDDGIAGEQGVSGKNSLIDMSTENPGMNCENGGVKIETGFDNNFNGILDSNEVQNTKYVCNQDGGIITEEVRIKIAEGTISTTSITGSYLKGFTFDITKYKNVNSIIFEAKPYVFYGPNILHNNFALLELYNFTDNMPISNSLIRTNNLSANSVFLGSSEIINEIPKKEIQLGLKIRSEVEGLDSESGNCFLILKK